jgi:type I pantothenate kinase
MTPERDTGLSYEVFTRGEWAALRRNTPLTLTEEDLAALRGLNEPITLDEVAEVILPLTRLLNLHITAVQQLVRVTDIFLERPSSPAPFVIGVAGSVSAGKSTLARVLREVLSRWVEHRSVELLTTDGFLHPNAVLEARGIMHRKGFPESYDLPRLVRFLADVKAGRDAAAPVYSHLSYDIVPGEERTFRHPDVLIVEGINVLQPAPNSAERGARTVVSDFFDFSIFLDADADDLERWYVDRFLALCQTAFRRPESYFHRFASLSEAEARTTAIKIWREINLVNLEENIAATRDRATVVLRKGPTHAVEEVRMRRASVDVIR